MGFWIFMLIMDLLIPLTMLGFGRWFLKQPPKEINGLFGYRSTRSMKNKATWAFAHKYCGRLWYFSGLLMLPITLGISFLTLGKGEDLTGIVGGLVCGLQLVCLMATILPTERALKKHFDEHGNPR